MKKLLPRALTLMLALVLALQMTALAAPAADMVDYLIDNQAAVSLQYALMDEGEIVQSVTAGVYSLLDETETLHEYTMYGTGSVSKVFTTVIVMKLVDDGLLELDKPVVDYLPGFEMADARYKDITVRHLLNHSSGLPGSTWPGGVLWDSNHDGASTAAHDSFLALMKTMRLKADPGAYSVYCNDGFTLAELVCEAVTGQTFTQLIEAYIRLPLGLDHTATPQDGFDREFLARTYTAGGAETPEEMLNGIGAGGVFSSAEDLVTFGQIFTGEADVLSEASQKATMEKEYLNGQWLEGVEHNILSFGLGWDSVELFPFDRYGIKALYKGGDSTVYHAALIVLPEHNMSAAVLTSGGDSTSNMMVAAQLLLEQLVEKGVIEEILPELPAYTAEAVAVDIDLDGLAGPYANALMAYTVAFEEDGALVLSVPAYGEEAKQRFVYVGDGRWLDSDNGIYVWFVYENDAVYLAQDQLMNIPGFGQTVMAMYAAQQVPDYTPDEATLAAWMARNGTFYFMVNEPYNSVGYMSFPATSVMVDEGNPGYMNVYRLEDADTLVSWVQVPINMGRDWADIEMYVEDGVEYMVMRGYTFVSMQAVAPIWAGSRSVSTIQANGHARWYMVGAELEGKTLTITCPENAGFVVYDQNGLLVNQSAVTGQYTVEAPAGGFIAFAGAPGMVFEIVAE